MEEKNIEETIKNCLRIGEMWIRDEISADLHIQFLKQFNALLDDEQIDEIEVHICSQGGDFDYGISIFETIRLSPKPVTAIIQGMAFSAATIIAQAAQKIIMTGNSRMMLHPPQSILAEGSYNSDELKKIAKSLAKNERHVNEIFARKTGKSPEEIKKFVGDKKFFNAEEALEYGLADEII